MKKKQSRFNVKNVKYSVPNAGVYPAPADLAYAHSISLEADYNETRKYGDGEIIAVIGDDKGKTGTLVVTDLNQDYEIACGRMKLVSEGIADVQQRKTVPHAIYFETDLLDGDTGETKTVKTWLLNVVSGKPSESYQQTEDDPTMNNYEYSLTILGTNLRNNLDTADAVDSNGNTTKVFRISVEPGDTGYDTFEDDVPTPTETV